MSRLGVGLTLKDQNLSRDKVFKTIGLDEFRLDPANPKYQQQLAKEKGYINKIRTAINTYNTTADIQRELNKIMAERAGDPVLQIYSHIMNRPTFSLTNDEIEQTYQDIIKDL